MVVLSPFKRVPTRSGYRTYSCTTSKKSSNNIRTQDKPTPLFCLLYKPSVKEKRERQKGERPPLSPLPPPTSAISSLLTLKAEGQIVSINPPTQRYLTLSANYSWGTSVNTMHAYRKEGRGFDFQDSNNTLLKITDENGIAVALKTRLRMRTRDDPVSSEDPK